MVFGWSWNRNLNAAISDHNCWRLEVLWRNLYKPCGVLSFKQINMFTFSVPHQNILRVSLRNVQNAFPSSLNISRDNFWKTMNPPLFTSISVCWHPPTFDHWKRIQLLAVLSFPSVHGLSVLTAGRRQKHSAGGQNYGKLCLHPYS